MASLFPNRERIDGFEVVFRTICAVGWALHNRLLALREACTAAQVSWPQVIRLIEEDTIHRYEPSGKDAHHWLDDTRRNLENLADGEKFRESPIIGDLLRQLAEKMQLLTLLSRLPHKDREVQRAIEGWIRKFGPNEVYEKLRTVYVIDDKRLIGLTST